MTKEAAAPIRAAIIGDSTLAPFGLTARARLERQLPKAGMVAAAPDRAAILLSGGCLFGASVLASLARAAPGTVLIDDRGHIAAARPAPDEAAELARLIETGAAPPPGRGVDGIALAGRYDHRLRKRADPMVLRLTDRAAAERALFAAAYKGVTDLVTKHVWPAPALIVTRLCAAAGITPNQVTLAGAGLMVLTFWLFWQGAFGPGLLAAWAMTFLDTVDGKLARVTLTSSRLGDVLDHGIDLVHPPFWWWAWAVGLGATGQAVGDGGLALGLIVAGYVAQRAEEGVFQWRFGMHIHVWRRFDSLFRQVTARRNPNLVILTLAWAAGAPREGLIAVAVWTVLSFLIHLLRLAQAFAAARRGPLVSWLAEG